MSSIKKNKRAYVRLLPEDKVPDKLKRQWHAACRELAPHGIYPIDAWMLKEEDLYLGKSYHDTQLFEVLSR